MRIISLLIISSVVILCSCDTEGNVDPVYQNYFLKYYGTDGNQEGVDLLVNPDGSMIMLGNSSSQTDPTTTVFISKIDPFGTVLWQRQIGDLNEMAVDVESDDVGNLIVVSNQGAGDATRIILYRLAQNGEGLDSVRIDMNEKQVAKSVTVANDSILISGFAAPNPDRNDDAIDPALDVSDIIVIAVNNQMQAKVISQFGGGEYDGAGVKIFNDAVGSYVLCMYSDRQMSTNFRTQFEVFSLNGFFAADGPRAVAGIASETQVASEVIQTSGDFFDGYLMVGTTYANALASAIYVAHFTDPLPKDADETGLWFVSKIADNRYEGISIATHSLGGYYVLANLIRDNNKRDISLIKIGSDGITRGSTTFGALEGDDTAGAVRTLPDGRIVVLGTMELETQKKMVLVMLSPNANFTN